MESIGEVVIADMKAQEAVANRPDLHSMASKIKAAEGCLVQQNSPKRLI
jgi:hypothetical protein